VAVQRQEHAERKVGRHGKVRARPSVATGG
jgi:hypothetical protein